MFSCPLLATCHDINFTLQVNYSRKQEIPCIRCVVIFYFLEIPSIDITYFLGFCEDLPFIDVDTVSA
jgi:hypothetical protein